MEIAGQNHRVLIDAADAISSSGSFQQSLRGPEYPGPRSRITDPRRPFVTPSSYKRVMCINSVASILRHAASW